MSFNDSFPSSSELLNGRGRSKANVEARGLQIKHIYWIDSLKKLIEIVKSVIK